MEGLQPYPEYKDSGVPWLGEIPSHWDILRSGLLFREIVDTGHPELELLSIDRFKGIIKQHETGRKERASEDRSIYKRIKKGDLGYNLMNAFMGSIGISPHDGILSPAYAVGRPQKPMNPLFYHYLYRTPTYTGEFDCCSYGIMYERNRLYYERFKPIPAPYPPLLDQDQIVRTIQYFEYIIKDYIVKKRRTIDLLNEQKQAIIHQAVTRGLDPSVPMKDSGIEWLGEVPERWDIHKIPYICSTIGSGTTPSSGVKEYYIDGSIPWLNTGDLNDGWLDNCNNSISKKACDDYPILRKYLSGSLVVAMYGATVGKVSIIKFDTTCNQACCVLSDFHNVLPEFLLFWFIGLRNEILSMSRGGGQPNISMGIIRALKIPIPPLSEQKEIIDEFSLKIKFFNEIFDNSNEKIKLINEYRTRFITDFVTGKIDIRSIAATLPDVEDIHLDITTDEEPEEEFLDEEE